jgi:hypothetical protein
MVMLRGSMSKQISKSVSSGNKRKKRKRKTRNNKRKSS